MHLVQIAEEKKKKSKLPWHGQKGWRNNLPGQPGARGDPGELQHHITWVQECANGTARFSKRWVRPRHPLAASPETPLPPRGPGAAPTPALCSASAWRRSCPRAAGLPGRNERKRGSSFAFAGLERKR